MKSWLKVAIGAAVGFFASKALGKSSSSQNTYGDSIFRDIERIKKDVDKDDYIRLIEDFMKASDKLGVNKKKYPHKNYAELLKKKDKTNNIAKTTEERIEQLNEQINELRENMKILRANKPRRFDFADRRGKVDKDAYNEEKKDYDEFYKDLNDELKEAKNELKELKKELKEEAAEKAKEEKDKKKINNTGDSSSKTDETDKTDKTDKTKKNNKSSKKGKLSIVKAGAAEYIPDGTKRAEDALSDDILSKSAKTLSKDEQLLVLKKAGINVDKLKDNTAKNGNVSLQDGNKHFRVVNDNNEIKIIQTVIENGKAKTQVFKMSKV